MKTNLSHDPFPPRTQQSDDASKRGSARALMALNFCIADVKQRPGLAFFWPLMPETRGTAADDRAADAPTSSASAP